MDKQMNISDYAKWRDVSESTVRRWIKAGKVSAHQIGGRWLISVTEQMDRQSDRQNEQVEQAPALVTQLHSENEHLRKQVDHLTQVVAMQTQQQGDLVKRLEAPPRSPVGAWVRLKLQSLGLARPLLVIGLTLLAITDGDARYRSYDITVDRYDYSSWLWPNQSRSTYDIEIRDNSQDHTMCHLNPNIRCYPGGSHMAQTMPDDLLDTYWKIKRERKQQRLITAQTELLEAQTALARYQLRQDKRANRVPYRVPTEAAQREARKRLVARYATQSKKPSKKPETGIATVSETKPKPRHAFSKRRLKGKSHSPSVLSKFMSTLGLKKSHRCTADCVE